MTETTHPKRPYIPVFVALAVLTAIEVAVAGAGIARTVLIPLLLALAAAKALMVALFYMHLRYDHAILRILAGFPFVLALILTGVLLADLGAG